MRIADTLVRLFRHMPARDWPEDLLPPVPPPVAQGDALSPIAVGDRTALAGLLDELDVYLMGYGNDPELFSAWELVRLPKTTPVVGAVPPRVLWPNMGNLLGRVVMPARESLGVPFAVRGYRPTDYNRAVSGAAGSLHVDFGALDIRVSPEHRRALALYFAGVWDRDGKRLGMGLGVYGGHPTPHHVHVDIGRRRRKQWAATMRYVREVRKNPALAAARSTLVG